MSEDHTITHASSKEEVTQQTWESGEGSRRPIGKLIAGRRLGGRRVLVVWLAALVALLGVSAPGPLPPGVKMRLYIPSVHGPPKAWPWAFAGVAFTGGSQKQKAVVDGLTRWNFFDWSTGCDDPFDPTPSKIGLQRHIPEIWGAENFNDSALMDELFNGACNDGRPLFFLNEPNRGDQAYVAAGDAAEMFYRMTRGSWPRHRWLGPIYVSGVPLDKEDWVDRFLDAFATRYNNGSRSIPEIGGWHLHLYANWAGNFGLDPSLGALNDSALQGAVNVDAALIAAFIQHRRAEGGTTKIYFDEMGLLKKLPAGTSDGTPVQYAERMVALMRMQDAMLRSFWPDVEGYQWFTVYTGDPFCTSCSQLSYSASNLVYPDGTLTATGQAWRELAAAQQ
jgi:hypothetical protein